MRKGEMTESEYKIYLRMTFQSEVESLLGTKFDTAIAELGRGFLICGKSEINGGNIIKGGSLQKPKPFIFRLSLLR